MGDAVREARALRFIHEFAEDLEKLAIQDRGHTVILGHDDNNQVRFWVTVGEFDYMSPTVVWDPDSDFRTDLSDILEELGLPVTEENQKKVEERLRRAELIDV